MMMKTWGFSSTTPSTLGRLQSTASRSNSGEHFWQWRKTTRIREKLGEQIGIRVSLRSSRRFYRERRGCLRHLLAGDDRDMAVAMSSFRARIAVLGLLVGRYGWWRFRGSQWHLGDSHQGRPALWSSPVCWRPCGGRRRHRPSPRVGSNC
jgi:hypothetical protein